MSDTPFGLYAEYYDLLYQDKDYERELRYIRSLLDKHAPRLFSILEIGCGTGKHALSLARQGIDVLGIDRSQEMLNQAEKRADTCSPETKKRLHFERSDLESLRLKKKFDSVISLFHVFSYCTTDDSIDGFFEAANRHLLPGGALFFDCWHGPAVLADPPQKRTKEVQNQTHKVTRHAKPSCEPNDGVVKITYDLSVEDKRTGQIAQVSESHPMRYFGIEEVEAKLNGKGFRLELARKWLTEEPPDETNWSACYLAIKL